MRKLAFLVVSGVLGFVVPGCTVSPTDEPAQHGFARDATGQPVQANVSALDDFSPAEAFDHTLSNGSEQIAPTPGSQDLTCSGACNATTCVCSGDFNCCVAGCTACWQVLDQT